MTCCVGYVAPDRSVWLGADSAGVSGLDLTVRADRKLFRAGPFLVAGTSSFRMIQLLRYAFTPPAHPAGMDVEHFMATLFVDAVRECFHSGGYRHVQNEVEKGGTFLVGYRSCLFRVDSDFQCAESLAGYDAVGSGANVALGALYVATGSFPHRLVPLDGWVECAPREAVLLALHAAQEHNAGVRAPFSVESLPPHTTNAAAV